MTQLNRRTLLAGAATIPGLAVTGAAAKGIAEGVPDPVAEPGRIVHWRAVASNHVAPRDVTIWLPADQTGPLPVIYAHDGENLFDTAVSVDDWPLEFDRAMGELARAGIGPAIVVGIWATEERAREYNSLTVADDLPAHIREVVELSCGGALKPDAYIRFVTEELKPRVDAEFDTLAGPESTYVFGVSMGGLVAMESLVTRPDIFSRAAGMSAHMVLFGPPAGGPDFPIPEDAPTELEAALGRFAGRFPSPQGRRIWIARGTMEVDQFYGPTHTALTKGLIDKGWEPVTHLEARVYVGAGHHGRYWAPRRVAESLRFLLGS